jgi:hypothetical protein
MSEPATLTVRPGVSRGLAILLIAGHLSALAVVWLTLFKWWLSWPLSMVIAVSLTDVLRVHAFRAARRAIVRVDLEAGGAVSVKFRDLPAATGRLLRSSFVSSRLAILRVALPDRHFAVSIVIGAGSLPRQDFRRLLVWLRWRPPPSTAGGAVQVGAATGGHDPPPG